MKIILLTFLFLGSVFTKTFSQEKITLSGTIKDKKSTETLIGVNVYIDELKTGTNTNEYGFYSLTVPSGNYTLRISYVGFQTIEEKIDLSDPQVRAKLLAPMALIESKYKITPEKILTMLENT